MVAMHCTTIAQLSWNPFNWSTALKEPLEKFQKEINHVYAMLTDKKCQMTSTVPSIFANLKRSAIPSAFESVAGAVSIGQSEFYVPIEQSVHHVGKKKSGRKSAQELCRKIAKTKLTAQMKVMKDYEHLFLTDEDMGITEDAFGTSLHGLDNVESAHYRLKFWQDLSKGLQGVFVNIFGQRRSGMNNPTCIFVWKFPPFAGPDHIGNVQNPSKHTGTRYSSMCLRS